MTIAPIFPKSDNKRVKVNIRTVLTTLFEMLKLLNGKNNQHHNSTSLPFATGQIPILNTFAEDRVFNCCLSHITSTSAHLGLIWDIAPGEKMSKKKGKHKFVLARNWPKKKIKITSYKLSCSSHKDRLDIKVELKVIKVNKIYFMFWGHLKWTQMLR